MCICLTRRIWSEKKCQKDSSIVLPMSLYCSNWGAVVFSKLSEKSDVAGKSFLSGTIQPSFTDFPVDRASIQFAVFTCLTWSLFQPSHPGHVSIPYSIRGESIRWSSIIVACARAHILRVCKYSTIWENEEGTDEKGTFRRFSIHLLSFWIL